MSRARPSARWRRARRERGAAVMLVVLVLTMLMGIGLFAARTAQLSVGASGYDRQMTQTHYITQYAVLAMTSELTARPDDYAMMMSGRAPNVPVDTGCSGGLLAAGVQNFTCMRVKLSDIQGLLTTPLLPAMPGTALGNANIEADWTVEVSDLASIQKPVAGMPQNPNSPTNVQFKAVTLTATGQVRPILLGPTAVQTQSASSSIETQRARVIFGPISSLGGP